jgi:hypothetical protein
MDSWYVGLAIITGIGMAAFIGDDLRKIRLLLERQEQRDLNR